MRRRDFVALLGGAITAPLAAPAQQKGTPVIGYLGGASPGPFARVLAAFKDGLRETGYVESENLAIEYRWAEGHFDRLPVLAADLVDRKVDLIFTSGGTAPPLAAKNATSTIPIVFSAVNDPVGVGLVTSLARPGGNITGMSLMVPELTQKRLELITELVPQGATIAMLVDPKNPGGKGVVEQAQEAAREKGVQLNVLTASTENELVAAFASLSQLRAGALMVGTDPFFTVRHEQIVELAARHAIPAIFAFPEYVTAGGLISFGPDGTALHREAGIYAGRILKGEKPADLPVQQPTRFELVINLKTAQALGLTVPQSILQRADEVIE